MSTYRPRDPKPPSLWEGFQDGLAICGAVTLVTAPLLAAFAWFVILPTVGLLYAFGVLP